MDHGHMAPSAASFRLTLRFFYVLATIEGQFDGGSEASHRVVHQDSDRKSFRECNLQFATKNMGELFALAAVKRGTAARLMMQLASPLNTNSSSRGHFFEAVMHAVMRSGGSFEYRLVDVPCDVPPSGQRGWRSTERFSALQAALDKATDQARIAGGIASGAPLRMTVPQLVEKAFKGGSNSNIGDFDIAAKCASPCYLRPNNDIHPVIDACIYPNILLNFKVAGNVGSLNEQLLENHLQGLPDLPLYYFDYIVPAHVYPTFNPPPLKRDAKKHLRVTRTHVRVVKAKLTPVCSTMQMQMRTVRSARLRAFSVP